jgi:triosephosphate isomerase
MSQRTKIIAGNWKMYKNLQEAQEFLHTLDLPAVEGEPTTQYILAVPFTMLALLSPLARSKGVILAAQNMHDVSEGAFTGEIAAPMLLDAGAKAVLLGHSERRQHFGETDSFIQKKLKKALESNLFPILCIGETLEEMESSKTESVLRRQLAEGLKGISINSAQEIAIAYEPVWAIGTGKAATAEQANGIHEKCREILGEVLKDRALAEKISILYGGSVKPDNAKELLSQENIDGVLVGGASLKPESFASIARAGIMEKMPQEEAEELITREHS